MDLKVEIGKKIRNLRINRGLTMGDLCDDESELTIRQLVRIENGQAMITVPKLLFISEVLEIPIQELVDIDKIEVPKRYLEIKNKLIKSRHYGDPHRIKVHEDMFDEIYEHFYDYLPEEEQLLVELLQTKLDVWVSQNSSFALGLFEEYFHQIRNKKHYSYNDLVLIHIYFFCCAVGLEEDDYCDELIHKVITQIDYSDFDKMYLLERIISAFLTQTQPENYLTYTKILREIVTETNDFQHKPTIYAFEAKYYLQVEKNLDKTKLSYEKSIQFAQMLNDDFLAMQLTKEMQKDLAM